MSEWTQRERDIYRYQMARRRDDVLCVLPNGSVVHESDLDVRLKERVGVLVAYILVAALVIAAIVAPLAIGGLLINALNQ